MAERVILLGPSPDTGGVGTYCHALEMTALDADALVTGGVCKVRIAQFSGDVANATVLDLAQSYIDKHGSYEKAWAQIDGFLGHMRSVTRRQVKTPIPLWNGGRRTFIKDGDHARLLPEPGDLARLLVEVKTEMSGILPSGFNVLVEAVSTGGEIVTIKWINGDGTVKLLNVASVEIEAVP